MLAELVDDICTDVCNLIVVVAFVGSPSFTAVVELSSTFAVVVANLLVLA